MGVEIIREALGDQKALWFLQGLSEDTEEEKPAESTFTAER